MIGQITRLQLENFLTWRTLDWAPSHPIACLIGENDSGKSNLLRAFEFLAECTQKPLHEIFHQQRPFSHFSSPQSTWFRIALEGTCNFQDQAQSFTYELKITQSFESGPVIVESESLTMGAEELQRDREQVRLRQTGGDWQNWFAPAHNQTLLNLLASATTSQLEVARALTGNPARGLARDFSHLVSVRLNATAIRRACEPDRPLMPTGENLAATLDTLSSNPEHRAAFENVERRVRELLPRVKSVGVKSFRDSSGTSKRILKFGSESAGKPFYFEADAASDGTLYVLALIVFSQTPNASGISLVEEPEIGLHPHLLDSFVNQLRDFAKDQQVIMTTHSPLLLDSLNPEEVWITTRDHEGFSVLANMASYSDLDRWRDNFNTGEIWMNVPETQLAASE